jgi:glycosyltransferase involved in cell wall biosynthesis
VKPSCRRTIRAAAHCSPCVPLPGASACHRPRPCTDPRAAVVAIPAKNEADRIGACLLALARQSRKPEAAVLLLNNCTDQTEAVAHSLSASLPFALYKIRHTFPRPTANAGNARRLAMQYAAGLAGAGGVLLTTDADGVVAEDWIERALLAVSDGAELVCGRAEIDLTEAALIPAHLHADDALECELTELVDQIACRLDPEPADPWPRHTEAAGASLAVTVAAFTRVGGVPAVASGEDRAFVDALARIDARIRHDPTVRVTVSGRLHGRAAGGMADTIRRRICRQDEFTDVRLEPAMDAYRRAGVRRRVRADWAAQQAGEAPYPALIARLGIPNLLYQRMLSVRHFGATWAKVQANTPFLTRRRVRFAELPRQIADARKLLERHAGCAAVQSPDRTLVRLSHVDHPA